MAPVRASKFIITVAIMLLAACSVADDIDARLAEAEDLLQQAAEAGYEWLETAALLEQARTEMANGNLDSALALIEKAQFQAEAALIQAEREAESWRSRVLR
jgi:hypothetical protein